MGEERGLPFLGGVSSAGNLGAPFPHVSLIYPGLHPFLFLEDIHRTDLYSLLTENLDQTVQRRRAQIMLHNGFCNNPWGKILSPIPEILQDGKAQTDPSGFSGAKGNSLMFSEDSFQFTDQSLFTDKICQTGAELLNFYHHYINDNLFAIY
jgi:hypothetical protein